MASVRHKSLEIHRKAKGLIHKYSLNDWLFVIKMAPEPTWRGWCCYQEKLIALDLSFVINESDFSIIEDIICHEIAHALTEYDEDHGYGWIKKAREVGASEQHLRRYQPMNLNIINHRALDYIDPNAFVTLNPNNCWGLANNCWSLA